MTPVLTLLLKPPLPKGESTGIRVGYIERDYENLIVKTLQAGGTVTIYRRGPQPFCNSKSHEGKS